MNTQPLGKMEALQAASKGMAGTWYLLTFSRPRLRAVFGDVSCVTVRSRYLTFPFRYPANVNVTFADRTNAQVRTLHSLFLRRASFFWKSLSGSVTRL
jgi:hypothetical protein